MAHFSFYLKYSIPKGLSPLKVPIPNTDLTAEVLTFEDVDLEHRMIAHFSYRVFNSKGKYSPTITDCKVPYDYCVFGRELVNLINSGSIPPQYSIYSIFVDLIKEAVIKHYKAYYSKIDIVVSNKTN